MRKSVVSISSEAAGVPGGVGGRGGAHAAMTTTAARAARRQGLTSMAICRQGAATVAALIGNEQGAVACDRNAFRLPVPSP
jgi:hypothetical protein